MSLRFGSSLRLRVRAEFTAVQDRGRRVATRYLTVLAMPNAFDHDRLGIIASRRFGGAVARNRAKRLVREAFRSTGDLWPGGIDVVVIVRRPLGELKLPSVVEEWRGAARGLSRRLEKLARVAPEPAEGKTGRGA